MSKWIVTFPVFLLTLLAGIGCSPIREVGPLEANTPTLSPRPAETRSLPPAFTPTVTSTTTPTALPTLSIASDGLAIQAAGLLADYRDHLRTLTTSTRYWLEVEVRFEPLKNRASLKGTAQIRYNNQTGEELELIPLMLWPNENQYLGEMAVEGVTVDGESVPTIPGLDGIVLWVQLPQKVEAEQVVDITVAFGVEARGPIGGSQPRRFGISRGVLFAPTFYPMIPPFQEGGWLVGRPAPGGDTTSSEVAFYQVEITANEAYPIVTSGVEIRRESLADGQVRVTAVTGPMRDFALALGEFATGERQVGEVRLRGWVLPEHESDLDPMLEAAADQLALLVERIGPYPYPELDLVDLPGAFGGIEYPGLVTVGTLGGPGVIRPTVHEVGHQWFYGLIGNDQQEHPWLDEAAATYTEVLYYEEVSGSGRATGALADFREILQSHPEPTIPIGKPVGEYGGVRDYGLFVYLKGALFFDALRLKMGDDAFFEFLQAYYQEYRYRIVGPQDFQEVAEGICRCSLQALLDTWVYEGGEVPGLTGQGN